MFAIAMNKINVENDEVVITLEVVYGKKEYDAYLLCNKKLTYVKLFSKLDEGFNIHDISQVDPVKEFGPDSDIFYHEVFKIPHMLKETVQACC